MSIKKITKEKLNKSKSWLIDGMQFLAMDNHMLMGRMASWQVRSMEVVSSLQDVEFKVSSQWGEDGIIDWLIERAEIPPALHSFVEFGVETYREANTRFLLQNRNWRGLIMDGSPNLTEAVKKDGLYWKHDLVAKAAFITRENIDNLLSDSGFHGEIGLLSIDLDGNDYWVWEAIQKVRPIVCICEYNAVFGDVYPISVPYDPQFQRTTKHFSNLYFGASIAALCSLAKRKGYRFVGTTSAANDAFFVREDYAERFVDNSLRHIQPLPSKARESIDVSGQLTYVSGVERLKIISDMPIINVETGETAKLGELDSVYSKEWLAAMTGSS